MGDGYKAPHEAIIKTGGNVSSMTKQATAIKDKVAEAEVPEISWGLLGLATTYSEYRDMLEKFKTHLDEIGKNLTEVGDKITACGKGYQDDDKLTAQELEKVLGELEKGPKV
jgi:hypothetical protein